VESPNAVSVSSYEGSIKGFRVRLVGCLTCEAPLDAPGGEKLLLTLKIPSKGAETMGAGVELARPAVAFKTVEEARAWEDTVKPQLRAEFVFRPTPTEWTFHKHRGLAFTLVASRVFNRCTGEVIFSEPRSEDKAWVPPGIEGCSKGSKEAMNLDRAVEGGEAVPLRLGAAEINQALLGVQPDLGACDAQFKMRGAVVVEFVVGGDGTLRSVRARGPTGEGGVAACVAQAARKVQFPRFGQASQTFKYAVPLRGD
jgi:hypothetical protein